MSSMFARTRTFEKGVMWEHEITNKRKERTRIRKVCSSCQFFLLSGGNFA